MASFVQEPDMRTLVAITDCVFALRQGDTQPCSALFTAGQIEPQPTPLASTRHHDSTRRTSQAVNTSYSQDSTTKGAPSYDSHREKSRFGVFPPSVSVQNGHHHSVPHRQPASPPPSHTRQPLQPPPPQESRYSSPPSSRQPLFSFDAERHMAGDLEDDLVDVEETSLRYNWRRDERQHSMRRDVEHVKYENRKPQGEENSEDGKQEIPVERQARGERGKARAASVLHVRELNISALPPPSQKAPANRQTASPPPRRVEENRWYASLAPTSTATRYLKKKNLSRHQEGMEEDDDHASASHSCTTHRTSYSSMNLSAVEPQRDASSHADRPHQSSARESRDTARTSYASTRSASPPERFHREVNALPRSFLISRAGDPRTTTSSGAQLSSRPQPLADNQPSRWLPRSSESGRSSTRTSSQSCSERTASSHQQQQQQQSASPVAVTAAAARRAGCSVASHGTGASRVSIRSATPDGDGGGGRKESSSVSSRRVEEDEEERSRCSRRSQSSMRRDLLTEEQPQSAPLNTRHRSTSSEPCSGSVGGVSVGAAAKASQAAAARFVLDTQRRLSPNYDDKNDEHHHSGGADVSSLSEKHHDRKRHEHDSDSRLSRSLLEVDLTPLHERYAKYTTRPASAAAGGRISQQASLRLTTSGSVAAAPRLASPPKYPHDHSHLFAPALSGASRRLPRDIIDDPDGDDDARTTMLRAAVRNMQEASNAAMDASHASSLEPSHAAKRYALLVESARLLSSSVLVFTAHGPVDRLNATSAARSASAVFAATPSPVRPSHASPSAVPFTLEEAVPFDAVGEQLMDPDVRALARYKVGASLFASPFPSEKKERSERSEVADTRERREAEDVSLSPLPRPVRDVTMRRALQPVDKHANINGASYALPPPPQPRDVHPSRLPTSESSTTPASRPETSLAHATSSHSSASTVASAHRRTVMAPSLELEDSPSSSRSELQRWRQHVEEASDAALPAGSERTLLRSTSQADGAGRETSHEDPSIRSNASGSRSIRQNGRQDETMADACDTVQEVPARRYYAYVSPKKKAISQQTAERLYSTSPTVSPLTPPPLSSPEYHTPSPRAAVFECTHCGQPPLAQGQQQQQQQVPAVSTYALKTGGAVANASLADAIHPHPSSRSPRYRSQAGDRNLNTTAAAHASGKSEESIKREVLKEMRAGDSIIQEGSCNDAAQDSRQVSTKAMDLLRKSASRSLSAQSGDHEYMTEKSSVASLSHKRRDTPEPPPTAFVHVHSARTHDDDGDERGISQHGSRCSGGTIGSGSSNHEDRQDEDSGSRPRRERVTLSPSTTTTTTHTNTNANASASFSQVLQSAVSAARTSLDSAGSGFDWVADDYAAAAAHRHQHHLRYSINDDEDDQHDDLDDDGEDRVGADQLRQQLPMLDVRTNSGSGGASTSASHASAGPWSGDSPLHYTSHRQQQQQQPSRGSFSAAELSGSSYSAGAAPPRVRTSTTSTTASSLVRSSYPPPLDKFSATQSIDAPFSQVLDEESGRRPPPTQGVHAFSFAGSLTSVGVQSSASMERMPRAPSVIEAAALELSSNYESQAPRVAAFFTGSPTHSTSLTSPLEDYTPRGVSEGEVTRVLWVDASGRYFAHPNVVDADAGQREEEADEDEQEKEDGGAGTRTLSVSSARGPSNDAAAENGTHRPSRQSTLLHSNTLFASGGAAAQRSRRGEAEEQADARLQRCREVEHGGDVYAEEVVKKEEEEKQELRKDEAPSLRSYFAPTPAPVLSALEGRRSSHGSRDFSSLSSASTSPAASTRESEQQDEAHPQQQEEHLSSSEERIDDNSQKATLRPSQIASASQPTFSPLRSQRQIDGPPQRTRLAMPSALSKPPMVPAAAAAATSRPRLAETENQERLKNVLPVALPPLAPQDNFADEADFYDDGDDEDGYCSYGYGGDEMDV